MTTMVIYMYKRGKSKRQTSRERRSGASGHSHCRRQTTVESFLNDLIFLETDLTHFPFIRRLSDEGGKRRRRKREMSGAAPINRTWRFRPVTGRIAYRTSIEWTSEGAKGNENDLANFRMEKRESNHPATFWSISQVSVRSPTRLRCSREKEYFLLSRWRCRSRRDWHRSDIRLQQRAITRIFCFDSNTRIWRDCAYSLFVFNLSQLSDSPPGNCKSELFAGRYYVKVKFHCVRTKRGFVCVLMCKSETHGRINTQSLDVAHPIE